MISPLASITRCVAIDNLPQNYSPTSILNSIHAGALESITPKPTSLELSFVDPRSVSRLPRALTTRPSKNTPLSALTLARIAVWRLTRVIRISGFQDILERTLDALEVTRD
jgi:hypothetical protein